MKKSMLTVAMAAVVTASAHADSTVVDGPMGFNPIAGSAYGHENAADVSTTPWIIPEGFAQSVLSDESALNLYVTNDWPDMNTVNETRLHAGRYLYRTHEVRGGAVGNDGNSLRVDGGNGGAVSVLDLKTGAATELVGRTDWEALDGLVWTPWHTLLFAEEVIIASRPDPDHPIATSGLMYELLLDRRNPAAASGVAEWVALDMNQVQVSARVAAAAVPGPCWLSTSVATPSSATSWPAAGTLRSRTRRWVSPVSVAWTTWPTVRTAGSGWSRTTTSATSGSTIRARRTPMTTATGTVSTCSRR